MKESMCTRRFNASSFAFLLFSLVTVLMAAGFKETINNIETVILLFLAASTYYHFGQMLVFMFPKWFDLEIKHGE